MSRPASLGALVRAARRAAGLSGRDLARRCGLPQPTLVAIEAGRNPTLSSLRRLIEGLPELDATTLLAAPPGPWPASRRTWRFFADLFGFEAEEIALTVDVRPGDAARSTLHVRDLGMRRRPPRGVDVAGPLLGAAFSGPSGLLLSQLARPARRVPRAIALEHEGVRHDLALRTGARGPVVTSARCDAHDTPVSGLLSDQAPHGRPFERGACAWVDVPARRLVVRVRFAGGCAPAATVIHAFPATLACAPGSHGNAWPDLFPHAPRALAPDPDGRVELVVEAPPPGLVYGLSWDGGAADASPVARAVARPRVALPVSRVLARARARSGLSRRQLARSLRVSPATVAAIETGSEPRRDTLLRCLEVLPCLRAAELLRRAEPLGEVTAAEAWRQQRALFGVEVAREVRAARVLRSGDVILMPRTEGIVFDHARVPELRLRQGISRGPHTSADWTLERITTGRAASDDPRVRVLHRGGGPTVYDLRFTGSPSRPLTYERRVRIKQQIAITPDAPHATRDDRGHRAEIFYLEPDLPAREALLDVTLPPGYWPDEVLAVATPRAAFPSMHPEDLGRRLHGDRFGVELDRARRRLRLRVLAPLVGMRYAIHWFVRDSRTDRSGRRAGGAGR
jgi:transcriptional regulator with XRE-family HTH domain